MIVLFWAEWLEIVFTGLDWLTCLFLSNRLIEAVDVHDVIKGECNNFTCVMLQSDQVSTLLTCFSAMATEEACCIS